MLKMHDNKRVIVFLVERSFQLPKDGFSLIIIKGYQHSIPEMTAMTVSFEFFKLQGKGTYHY